MFTFDRVFIMLCNEQTEAECLSRNLFGDIATRIKDLDQVKPGDLGLLFNYEKDELIGIFRASSKAQLNIERIAWNKKFPAQIRVELIGQLQRVKDATYLLNKAGVGLRPLPTGLMIPAYPVHGKEVIECIIQHFKEPIIKSSS